MKQVVPKANKQHKTFSQILMITLQNRVENKKQLKRYGKRKVKL